MIIVEGPLDVSSLNLLAGEESLLVSTALYHLPLLTVALKISMGLIVSVHSRVISVIVSILLFLVNGGRPGERDFLELTPSVRTSHSRT